MRRQRLSLVLVMAIALGGGACSPAKKEAWHESGASWRGMGNQFRRALGMSIQGEGDLKQEWKQVGRDGGEAGRDTAQAVGRSITPEERRSTSGSGR